MGFEWMVGFLLLIQVNHSPDIFYITENNEPILIVNREDFLVPLPGMEVLDTAKFNLLAVQLEQQVKKEPENAKLDDTGKIVPEKKGYKLNRHAFLEQFYQLFYQKGSSTIEVPKMSLYPKVDSELLSMIYVKKIGQYVTYFNPQNKARSRNIALATEAINNYVVFPGEIFSFNKTVGKRTEERGYMKAPEIVKGEMTEGIGGGICQVSSTLFNAVDRSGVKIVERYSHSRHVPYVPPGRDATVSWYGPDFSFENNYNQPILIRAKASHGRVMVNIYSSEDIMYNPRSIPNASKKIPQEIHIDAIKKR